MLTFAAVLDARDDNAHVQDISRPCLVARTGIDDEDLALVAVVHVLCVNALTDNKASPRVFKLSEN